MSRPSPIAAARRQVCRRAARIGPGLAGVIVIVVGSMLGLGGCVARPQSTRMTADDLIEISTAMVASLRASDAIGDRTPASPPWVITIQRVRNLSSDVIPESEQWLVVQRVRSSIPVAAASERLNLRFVMPIERVRELRDQGLLLDEPSSYASEREPTHVLGATFRSITRATSRGRVDQYFAEFEILEIATGEPVWNDRFEYKRAAEGRIVD